MAVPMAATVVLPGDKIARSALPTLTGKRKTLALGPGLRHSPPTTITATVAGALVTDGRKNNALVESNSGKYIPFANDLVIATVNGSAAESFNCLLAPHTAPAILPHLAFEGASKKTRPHLPPNSLVYCRIASVDRDLPPELTCVDPSTGKGDGLGILKGGMVFPISLGMARRMLVSKGGLILLDLLGAKMGFEITIGRNGFMHVDGGSVRNTLAIGRAIQQVDQEALGEKGQRRLAAQVLKSF